MKKNIFLIGFMGAGKSTVARMLSEKYGMHLIEMDEQIEAEENRKISEIFAQSGEAYFRELETKLLLSLEVRDNCVVSCGGGVPMRTCNVEAMHKSGRIVYLCTKPETVLERIGNQHTRPLLEGNMNVAYISELMEKRLPAYLAAADVSVQTDGRSVEEICGEILKRV